MTPSPPTASCIAALSLLLATSADAGWVSVRADCNGSTMTLEISVSDPGGLPELVGFDLYRSTMGECTEPSRITDEPLSRPIGTFEMFDYTDPDLPNDTAYRYELVPVDAARERVWAAYDDAHYSIFKSGFVDIAACGRGAIAHGYVDTGWPGFGDCEYTCYEALVFLQSAEPGVLDDYYGTDTAVLLYGDVACSWEGCGMDVLEAEPLACEKVVPVVDGSWSRIRAVYRSE